jgi:hypothetical protein
MATGNMQIPHEKIEKAYAVAKLVQDDAISFAEGVRRLAAIPMNRNSAADCIRDLKQMLRGAAYKRALNKYATEYFLTNIERDYGRDSLRKACSAVAKHLDYYEGLGYGRQRAIHDLLERFSARLDAPSQQRRLVATEADIRHNLLALERCRQSADANERGYSRSLIKNGRCFVAYRYRGRTFFGPSRYVGYVDNALDVHDGDDDKDGRTTNRAIERVLNSRFEPNAALDAQYSEFCRLLGVVPKSVTNRKFIEAGDIPESDDLADDLREIAGSTRSETEKKRLTDSRIGQNWFRDALLKIWGGCRLTGCADPRLLRASHIRPWKASTDAQRLDPYNGLLLSPNLDLAFDRGLISFDADGRILLSRELRASDARALGISDELRLPLRAQHLPYLEYHRRVVFHR